MATDSITTIAIQGEVADWTIARLGRGDAEVVQSGRVHLQGLEEDAAAAVEPLREACGGKGAVTLGVSSDDLILQVLSLPTADDEEIAGMVELQVDKFSPFPVDTMVVSHEVLARAEEESRVLVVAVQRSVIEQWGKTLEAARLAPTRVDASILGRWRVLKDADRIAATGRQVVLLVGEATAELIVAQDGVPILLRALPGRDELSVEEWVEEIAGEISYTLMSLDLAAEVGGALSALVCCEPGLSGPFQDLLREQCGCDVETLSPADLPPATDGLAGRAAERGSGRVDLVPREWRAAEESAQFMARAKLAAVGMVGAWILMVGGFFGWLQYQRARLGALEGAVEQMKEPAGAVAADKRRVKRIQRYDDRTYSALECLRAVTLARPNGVDLTSFRYDRMRGSGGLMIDGQAASADLVYRFQNELDKVKLFRATSLPSPVQRDRKTRKSRFKIKVDLAGSGGDA
jgi:hypothetical protein